MRFHYIDNGVSTSLPYGRLDISGNEDDGFRPIELMVASVAGCSASVFKKVLDKKRIMIEDLSLSAEVERVPDEANKISAIQLLFTVKGNNLPKEQLEKSLMIARKNCSMIRTIEDAVTITERLDVIQLSN